MNMEKSVATRLSKALAEDGFTPIPNALLKNYIQMEITSEESLFLIHCFRYKWTAESPYPSFKTLAKEMGKSRNTIQGYARSLQKKGCIKRIFVDNKPSLIDLTPLIIKLEQTLYQNPDREHIKKLIRRHSDFDTKEEPLRKRNLRISNKEDMQSIKAILENRKDERNF